MNRDQLVTAISQASNLPKTTVSTVISSFVDVVKQALRSGEKVTLVGFGTFYRIWRDAREGLNPQTREKMTIQGSWLAKFKAATDLRKQVNTD